MTILKNFLFSVCVTTLVLCASEGFTQTLDQAELNDVVEIKQDDPPVPIFDEPTHPPVKLSPDKSKLIRLDQTVDRVIVGNPNHLAVLPSDKSTVVLVGRAPGATYFTAMDDKGEIIMQRHVFVAAPQENYIRIRRACAVSEQDNCQATQVYYCPDTCHNVAMGMEDSESDSGGGDSAPGGEGGDEQILPDDIDSATE